MSLTNKKKSGCGCLTLSILALIGIGAGVYFGRDLMGRELSLDNVTEIIPASATMTGYISTNAHDWRQLSQFGTPEAQKIVREGWENFSQEIGGKNAEINYQQDIQPWLGGILLTLLPSSSTGINYDLVAILGVKNKIKAFQFWQKINKNSEIEITTAQYQNIDLFQLKQADSNPLFLSFFQNYAVISPQERAIKQIIDTFKGDDSLANQAQFSQAFTQKLQLKNVVMRFYVPDYDKLVQNLLKNSLPQANNSEKISENLTDINSIVIGLGIENHGLQLQALADLATPLDKQEFKPISHKFIAKLPDDTIFMVNGAGINRFWQELEKQKKLIPDLQDLVNQGEILANKWLNLDLAQDTWSWLDGEFALGLSTTTNNSFLNSGLIGSFIMETSSHQQAELALEKIEKVTKFMPFLQVTEQNIQGIKVKEWQIYQSPLISYGWLNQDYLMMSIGTNFKSINNINYQSSLLNNDNFKLTIQSLPKDNYGYFFMDVEKALTIAPNFKVELSELFSPEVNAMLASVKAIAITNSLVNPSTSQLDMNISLQKSETPRDEVGKSN
jgi:hypothetical protein